MDLLQRERAFPPCTQTSWRFSSHPHLRHPTQLITMQPGGVLSKREYSLDPIDEQPLAHSDRASPPCSDN
jgi:hypothetical protein